MKKRFQKQLSLVLCMLMVLGITIPVKAADDPLTISLSFTPSTIVAGSDAQMVRMDIDVSPAIPITGASYAIIFDHTAFKMNDNYEYAAGEIERSFIQEGRAEVTVTPENQNEEVGSLGTFYFSIPNGLAVGEYEFEVTEINIGTARKYPETLTQALKAAEAAEVAATLSGPSSAVVNTPVTYSVEVAGQRFSAAELKLEYDPEMLRFDSLVGIGTAKAENGILTIADFGSEKSSYTYQVTFTPIRNGSTSVVLQRTAVGTAVSAVNSNLTAITLVNSTVNTTVSKQRFPVTLPMDDLFSGVGEVESGGNYTFTIQNYNYYDFNEIKAMAGDAELTVIDNQNGTWTVQNVTGPLVITASYTPKTYTVNSVMTYPQGESIQRTESSATYRTDYTFTIPTAEHYTVTVDHISIGGAAYQGYRLDQKTVLIPGTDIKGAVIIALKATQADATVTVQGSGAADAEGYDPYATPGEDYVLKIQQDSLYNYTVTATIDGTQVTLNGDSSPYTIPGEQVEAGAIVFIVEKTLKADNMTAGQYAAINNSAIWLVQKPSAELDGRVYTYDGQQMFWSDAYDAYCCLVISSTQPLDTDKLGLIAGTANAVDYDFDVNKTGLVDANDAQLVYNMYNAAYGSFTDTVTMEKFLRADVNHDGVINTSDAVAVIHHILGIIEEAGK